MFQNTPNHEISSYVKGYKLVSIWANLQILDLHDEYDDRYIETENDSANLEKKETD